MKLFIGFLILSSYCFAQSVVTITITIDGKATISNIPANLITALASFSAGQTNCDNSKPPVCTSKYSDIGVLIISNLKSGLFTSVLNSNPPAVILTKQAAVVAAQADLDNTKAATLP